MEPSTLEMLARLVLASVLGALIGAERQWRQRNAGLRTNCLVSIGAALFVLLSVLTPAIPARRGSPRRSFPASAFWAPV
jgi:uncharacterized membrane protein YhiD involved in acid resistance